MKAKYKKQKKKSRIMLIVNALFNNSFGDFFNKKAV